MILESGSPFMFLFPVQIIHQFHFDKKFDVYNNYIPLILFCGPKQDIVKPSVPIILEGTIFHIDKKFDASSFIEARSERISWCITDIDASILPPYPTFLSNLRVANIDFSAYDADFISDEDNHTNSSILRENQDKIVVPGYRLIIKYIPLKNKEKGYLNICICPLCRHRYESFVVIVRITERELELRFSF